jgi:BolA protein
MTNAAPVQRALLTALNDAFSPAHLEVINESHMHNVPAGSETHFKVVIVADAFDGQNLVKRHRVVHKAVERELAGPVHAFSVHAFAPAQWEAKLSSEEGVAKSPPCHGGSALEK